jgi:hypothetical protein
MPPSRLILVIRRQPFYWQPTPFLLNDMARMAASLAGPVKYAAPGRNIMPCGKIPGLVDKKLQIAGLLV